MRAVSLALLATALALGALLAAPGARAQAQCPISRAQAAGLDFSGAAKACRPGTPQAQLCEACACALLEPVAPLARSAGLTPTAVQGVSRQDATAVLMACAPVLLPRLTAAGIALPTLLPLQSCPATPTCLAALANGGSSSRRV